MTPTVIALSKAWSDTIGIIFSWVILLPGLATGLIIVAVVYGRGEKAENEKLAGRWGPRAARVDDD
jgi:hypothetical protein